MLDSITLFYGQDRKFYIKWTIFDDVVLKARNGKNRSLFKLLSELRFP